MFIVSKLEGQEAPLRRFGSGNTELCVRAAGILDESMTNVMTVTAQIPTNLD